MRNNIRTQKGVFSIELSFALIGLCAFLYFIFDLGYQVIEKSRLDRTSYALVSVLKERKAFYTKSSKDEVNWRISKLEANEMLNMARKIQGNDKISVEIGAKQGVISEQVFKSGGFPCKSKSKVTNKMSNSTKLPLNIYRVTVCKKIPVFYERVISKDQNKTERILTSSSVFVGR